MATQVAVGHTGSRLAHPNPIPIEHPVQIKPLQERNVVIPQGLQPTAGELDATVRDLYLIRDLLIFHKCVFHNAASFVNEKRMVFYYCITQS